MLYGSSRTLVKSLNLVPRRLLSMATNNTKGADAVAAVTAPKKTKLTGRAFYESIGSPKHIVAPMVDQSEFAWRLLSRSYLPDDQKQPLLAYTPMLHARLFAETEKYRQTHFKIPHPFPEAQATNGDSTRSPRLPRRAAAQEEKERPWLDGNPALDRPLFVQFCANDPRYLLEAARKVAPYCDAVDLNLGCPQGIARKGHYGAFLQEDQKLIHELIRTLAVELEVPVTAKIRVLDTREATLAYARNVLDAGASILTVHGRRREQKGHLTGLADWDIIRFLRQELGDEVVLFANGNVLQHGDLERCLEATGADGVMTAEGNLSDPAIFAVPPPTGQEGREYWRGRDGRGGWRVDGIMRRYLNILHKYSAGGMPPQRRQLFVPGDDTAWLEEAEAREAKEKMEEAEEGPARKKRRRDRKEMVAAATDANYIAMQPHMFHMLRHLVTVHTDVRDALAQSSKGDLDAYERVLEMVEMKVARGLLEYEQNAAKGEVHEHQTGEVEGDEVDFEGELKGDSSTGAVRRCKRPWWVAQPIIRPLPKEALAKGSIKISKKNKAVMGNCGACEETAEGVQAADKSGVVEGAVQDAIEKQEVAG